jgi:hypothetical protein
MYGQNFNFGGANNFNNTGILNQNNHAQNSSMNANIAFGPSNPGISYGQQAQGQINFNGNSSNRPVISSQDGCCCSIM